MKFKVLLILILILILGIICLAAFTVFIVFIKISADPKYEKGKLNTCKENEDET